MSEEIKKENTETVIKINNLVKEYKMYDKKKDRLLEALIPKYQKHRTFRAMNDLNLEVKKGEILGILGKNGAGKSTLLKMITGVVFPTSGNIEINGKISSLLELGTAFNPELTGRENIYQHGQVFGLNDEQIKAKEQEIIDFADIGEHLNQPVKTYSSGMFARLAFACAINVDPDILIVDEVLSVGDMAFQLKCFKKFEQFKESGKTILFVSHSIADIIRNCTRTIIINSGKKIFDGSVKDGTEKYKKLVAGLDGDDKSKSKNATVKKETKKKKKEESNGSDWKSNFVVNDKLVDYGNGKAEVIDYGIFDTDGNIIQTIENDQEVILKSKVRFNTEVDNPIFTMTVKDFKGLDICGTNTLVEKMYTGKFKEGDVAIAEFRQKLPVSPNKYTLSFSCTHFTDKCDLEVLNRKYDALLVEVTSNKDTVGLLRLNSDIKVTKVEEK